MSRNNTPEENYERIKSDYILSDIQLKRIIAGFLSEMQLGLASGSSLKMLGSGIHSVPNGNEKGVYYALDWGGSNYRILRIEFFGINRSPDVFVSKRIKITKEYKEAKNPSKLFDFLASKLKSQMAEFGEDISVKKFPIGFTFSFPISQPTINSGILLKWTKGFNVSGVVGKNITELMHKSFAKYSIPAEIKVICNDTVGTLLSASFEASQKYKLAQNVRLGVIIGTGCNAAYIEPIKDNEVINIELGGFNKYLPRMKLTDYKLDSNSPAPGYQLAEKMISGYYIPEIVRLLSIQIFGNKITQYGNNTTLSQPFGKFTGWEVTNIVNNYFNNNINEVLSILIKCGLINFNISDAILFAKICNLILDRSADISVALILGTLQKTGLFDTEIDENNNIFYNLCQPYINNPNKNIIVGIDGAVFKRNNMYEKRMNNTLLRLIPKNISNRIKIVYSDDGSGKGAALAVAAMDRAKKQSSKL